MQVEVSQRSTTERYVKNNSITKIHLDVTEGMFLEESHYNADDPLARKMYDELRQNLE